MEFPVYRKYFNNKSYFKIISSTEFEELVIFGKNYQHTTYTAKILPDRVLIEDMINNEGNHWVNCSREEYEEVLTNCKNSDDKLG